MSASTKLDSGRKSETRQHGRRNSTSPPPSARHHETKRPSSSHEDDRKRLDYVKFLTDKERKLCKDGFVDSQQYRSAYGDKDTEPKGRRVSVVDVAVKSEQDQQEYEKRLRIIEELMWRHKKEARELHHEHGDIVKEQRAVRRTLREYENSINKKRLEESKKLNESLSQYTALQQKRNHEKEELSKQRLETDQSETVEFKDKDRKTLLKTTDLARKYRTKMTALELKRTEIDLLNKEFTSKIQSKEQEQYHLKQELAELAIALNMEAHKGQELTQEHQRVVKQESNERLLTDRDADDKLQTKLAHSSKDVKTAEANRRRLSLDLTMKSARLQTKHREEERRKIDTERRMHDNKEEQKRLFDSARTVENEQQIRLSNQRVQEHNRRKKEQESEWLRERQEKNESSTSAYTEKFQQRHREEQRRQHEDHLNHFQKAVQRGEQRELELYNKLKEAEQARQQLDQSVRRSEMNLMETRRVNAARIKEEMTEMQRQEMELEQSLLRERALLAKAQACREETYQDMQRHRERLRQDRYLLSEHEREHNRLARVGKRSDAAPSRKS
jgi:hypothetical protein